MADNATSNLLPRIPRWHREAVFITLGRWSQRLREVRADASVGENFYGLTARQVLTIDLCFKVGKMT